MAVMARDTASVSPAQTRSAQFSSGCGIDFLFWRNRLCGG
jgi:hypothetical protein